MTALLDVGPVVDMLAFDTVTLSRRVVSYNGQGVAVPGAPTTSTLHVSVQPAVAGGSPDGRNVQRSREGQRTTGRLYIYSRVELLPAIAPSQLSDEITFRGDVYTVTHSEQWNSTGYFRSMLEKKEVGA